TFLAEACAGDPELLAEVQSLIAAHERQDNFLNSPAYENADELLIGNSETLPVPSDAQAQSLIGRRLGAYQVRDKIDFGGQGEIYLAQDTRLGRLVALKLLPAHYTKDENRLGRFQQEARTASALNHPYILTIYEIGQADGLHYIATELIEGKT